MHQSRVCPCPLEFPAGYYWYGTKRKGPGRPPQWVQNFLEDGPRDNRHQVIPPNPKTDSMERADRGSRTNSPHDSSSVADGGSHVDPAQDPTILADRGSRTNSPHDSSSVADGGSHVDPAQDPTILADRGSRTNSPHDSSSVADGGSHVDPAQDPTVLADGGSPADPSLHSMVLRDGESGDCLPQGHEDSMHEANTDTADSERTALGQDRGGGEQDPANATA